MVKQTLIVFFILYCCITLLFYVFQRHLMYIPEQKVPERQDFKAADMTVVTLQTNDKLLLNSWYKPAINNQATILFLHGNAGHIGYRMPLARQFIKAGLGVLLLEYRGYGGNAGTPAEHGLYEDGRAAMRFLSQQGVSRDQIALYGESLGTGIATRLAVENPICAVILQSPYTSMPRLARYHYPWILIAPWDKFDSLQSMKHIHAPLLLLHGKQDELIPFSEGLLLFNQANEPKKMRVFNDKQHNDLWTANGFSETVIDFVQTHCQAATLDK